MIITTEEKPLIVGRVGRPFGVKGWLKIISFTEPRTNILKISPWLIYHDQKNHKTWQEITLTDHKIHHHNIVSKFLGYDSPEHAASLTNSPISVWRKQLPQLDSQEYYWHDLIGLEVINRKKHLLGQVIDLLATGANDVLIVEGEKRLLIPYISQVVLQVNLTKRTVLVDWDENFI